MVRKTLNQENLEKKTKIKYFDRVCGIKIPFVKKNNKTYGHKIFLEQEQKNYIYWYYFCEIEKFLNKKFSKNKNPPKHFKKHSLTRKTIKVGATLLFLAGL